MRISDWSSDVCSSDLATAARCHDRTGSYGPKHCVARPAIPGRTPATERGTGCFSSWPRLHGEASGADGTEAFACFLQQILRDGDVDQRGVDIPVAHEGGAEVQLVLRIDAGPVQHGRAGGREQVCQYGE